MKSSIRRTECGASLVEMALLVALVAVFTMIGVSQLGQGVNYALGGGSDGSGLVESLSGGESLPLD